MVLYRSGEMLYKGVCALVTENIDHLANTRIVPAFPKGTGNDPIQDGQEGETLLKAIRSVWDEHTSNMSKLRDILRYMVRSSSLSGISHSSNRLQDRVYTKSAGVPEIYDAGLNLFHKRIIRPPIKDFMVSTILRQVRIEREGFPINRSAVKGCVDVLLELRAGGDGPTVYVSELEPAFLRESKEFYEKESDHLLQACDAPEYLRRVCIAS
jgi:cullin 3